MKKALMLSVFLSLLVVTTMAMVSAALPICATIETTYVTGTVYESGTSNLIEGASVNVDCNGNIKNALSGADGGYSVEYDPSECDYGGNVSVFASDGDLIGNSENVIWYTEDPQIGCLKMIVNVACADVPMTPEFGVFVGALTLLSAVGVFFLVRKN